MRRITLMLAVVLLGGGLMPLAAQRSPLDAGTWGLGASTRLALSIGGSQRTAWGIDVAPQLTHFILPGLALGATARGAYYSFGTGSKHLWAIGPVLTWYPINRNGSFVPFVGAGLDYTWYREARDATPAGRIAAFEWMGSGGMMLRLGQSAGLQAGVQYGPARFRFDQTVRTGRDAPRQLRPALGVQVFL